MVEAGVGPAVAFAASSTIVGLHFQGVPLRAAGFAGSAPIAGKVQLSALWFEANIYIVGAEDPYRFRLAIASDVPSSAGDVDAGELVFPAASSVFATRGWVVMGLGTAERIMRVTTLLNMNGRRIVGEIYNAGGDWQDLFVGLVLHRVEGGDVAGDPAFLAGEHVERV